MVKVKVRMSGRVLRKRSRRSDVRVKKVCRFTNGEVPVSAIDYKNVSFLKTFLTERGKIIAARVSGNAAKYQRLLVREIKKARTMALLPYLALERRIQLGGERGERRGSFERGHDRGHERSGHERVSTERA